jgi:hypothetical protein
MSYRTYQPSVQSYVDRYSRLHSSPFLWPTDALSKFSKRYPPFLKENQQKLPTLTFCSEEVGSNDA